jgi:guanylate kinase
MMSQFDEYRTTKIPVVPIHDKKEKLIVLGKSGSGKDFMIRQMSKKGLLAGIKTTSRPPRKGEVQWETYEFVADWTFKEMIENDEFIVRQDFLVTPVDRAPETWYYGLTKKEFERAQAFIMTPAEFLMIDPETRKGCFVVYLDIDRSVREDRVLRRRDMNDSIKRRMDADDEDFKEFNKSGDYDLRVTDEDFNADDVWALMI